MKNELSHYSKLLETIKTRIQKAQIKATLSVNAEMVLLYWDIGRMIIERQKREGWGAGIIPRLSKDIRNELPEVKGFSERNIGYMIHFAQEYGKPVILQQPVAKISSANKSKTQKTAFREEEIAENLQHFVAKIPWGHNLLLMQKVKDLPTRLWYVQQTIQNGWSRNVLGMMIKSELHSRQGVAVSNFSVQLPDPQSDLAQQSLKDPYIFDFLSITEPFRERELEAGLVTHLEKFLIELGQGFAFVGRQYHLEVSDKDFYIDLLFYHLELRCFIVIELKRGDFKPEYAGKMNFYCSVVDDKLKKDKDKPTIGLILCQTKDRVLAEYALRDLKKPIGISDYELTRALPEELKSSLPSIEDIEKELKGEI